MLCSAARITLGIPMFREFLSNATLFRFTLSRVMDDLHQQQSAEGMLRSPPADEHRVLEAVRTMFQKSSSPLSTNSSHKMQLSSERRPALSRLLSVLRTIREGEAPFIPNHAEEGDEPPFR